MKCRYYFGHHAWLKIAPLKEEEIYLKPRIVLYYDVISDEEIQTVKDFASPRVSLNREI